ncbi:MAG: toxin-antitoxin system HicB family antitoxin [Longimicrobiales bacterium]|nr:toxin-antitoxin system HicB family antitoxin [Longimicrobiales bacterium]
MEPKYGADVRWSPEDEAFVAVCPELGDLSALGPTAHGAVQELESAVQLAVATYVEEGWPLPDPQPTHAFSGQFRVRLPRSLHAWLVREAAREGVSLNSFVMARLSEARGARSGSRGNVPTWEPA